MDTRERLKNVIYYLMNVNNMNSKVVKNILEYKDFFWEKNLIAQGCILKIKKNGTKYIEIQKECKNLYNTFSKLYLKLHKSKGDLELIWGYCFFTWKIKNKNIAHPLFFYKCHLEFDEENESYILEPVDNKFYMEIGILKNLSFDHIEELLKIKNKIEDELISIQKLDDIEKGMKVFGKELNIKVPKLRKIEGGLVDYKEIEIIEDMQFYHEPILIFRNHDAEKLNRELNDLFRFLNEGQDVPYTLKALVDDNYLMKIDKNKDLWNEIGQDPLYLLPVSKEQRQISKKIADNFGVVVKGPPGTGKTYSIANLICNFLANNKKVLVISNKRNILEKIFDTIPESIRNLCINYKEGSLESLSSIYNSINGFIDKIHLNLNEEQDNINKLENELKLCRKKQENVYRKLQISKNLDDKEIKYLCKDYKIKGIKKWIEENRKQYSWIDDDIKNIKEPPITDAKFSKLLYIMSNVTKKEIDEFNQISGLLYNIPPYLDLLQKIKRKCELERNRSSYRLAVKDWCISYNYKYNYENILKLLKRTQNFLISIESTWIESVLMCVKKGEIIKGVLQQTILKCNYYIKKIGSLKKETTGYKVEIPLEMEKTYLLSKLEDIYKQYNQKGKINKVFKLLHSECDEILLKCKVNSRQISNKNETKIVMMFIEEGLIKEKLISLWNNSMIEYGAEKIKNIDIETLSNLEDYIDKIDIIINWTSKVVNKIRSSMKEIVFLNKIDWYNKDTYSKLQRGVLSIKYISEYENIKSYILNIEKLISKVKGFEEIGDAINRNDIVSLKQCYKRIDRLKNLTPSIREMEYISQRLEKVCPKLITKLIEEKDRMNMLTKYKNLSVAWLWKQLNYAIEDEYDKFKLENINREIRIEREKENHIIQSLGAKKAWYNTVSSLKEYQKRSLYSFKEAVDKLGRASGKDSSMYINLAKEEIKKFQQFVPVWIMSPKDMIENLNISDDMFDIVMFDNANDMNLFSISALFRAKKAIIFGDENQANVEKSIQDNKRTKLFAKKYLKDVPNWQWINMKTSIYSTVCRVFPSTVSLKENFRSPSEITNFSSNLCYSGRVLSAKSEGTFGELWSPIKTVNVKGKRERGNPINLKEAEAIADTIVECCSNPLYKNMSMGVISLLGDDQGEVIKNLLEKKLGQDKIKERKILCGNPYTFQGEERDIIFLSMVISNNVKFATLTKDSDIRRLNIACSRAKKQMWLFHSVELQDMSKECIRYKLLDYCINFKTINKKGNLRIA
ncbi:DNA helicase [Clostridium botulinum C/D str. BKT12695]|nr:DNA helicase [Clostridium botulinum C/D str. BKT12695]